MKKVPDQGATKRDPWGTMRASPQGEQKSTQKTNPKPNQKATTNSAVQ